MKERINEIVSFSPDPTYLPTGIMKRIMSAIAHLPLKVTTRQSTNKTLRVILEGTASFEEILALLSCSFNGMYTEEDTWGRVAKAKHRFFVIEDLEFGRFQVDAYRTFLNG